MFNTASDAKLAETKRALTTFIIPDAAVEINYGGDRSAVQNMLSSFKKRMITMSMFDRNGRVYPNKQSSNPDLFSNALNENIYNYKQELVNQIFKLVSPGELGAQNYTSHEVFLNYLQLALSRFSEYNGETTSQTYKDARDAFSILKNFDALIKQETPFIGVSKKYNALNEGKDKYEYQGAQTDLFSTWTTKEEVDIEGQMSKTLKTILEIFPKYSENGTELPNTAISVKEFNQVMTQFKAWLTSSLPYRLLNIAESGVPGFIARCLRLNCSTAEDYRAADDALQRAFNCYIQQSRQKNVQNFNPGLLIGIQKLFQSGLPEEIKQAFWALVNKTEKNGALTTSVYNNRVSDRLLQDDYKEMHLYHIRDDINNAIQKFKWGATSNAGKNIQLEQLKSK